MSGCLVGDNSQREVLPLGPHSAHKYQRYALIFLFISQTLRRKERKLTFSGPLLVPSAVLSTFTYLISFNPQSNVEKWVLLLPFTVSKQTQGFRILPKVTKLASVIPFPNISHCSAPQDVVDCLISMQ